MNVLVFFSGNYNDDLYLQVVQTIPVSAGMHKPATSGIQVESSAVCLLYVTV